MTYDELLAYRPYELKAGQKREIFSRLLSELTDRHRKMCSPYNRACELLGDETGKLREVEEIPILPVSLLKNLEMTSVKEEDVFKVLTSSGTTGQRPSRIYLDRQTAEWQQRTLGRIISELIGDKRVPLLIVDSPEVLKDRNLFSARGAGILGFSMFGTKRRYALTKDMELDLKSIEEFEKEAGEGPSLIFGFTYIIWQHFYRQLQKCGKRLSMDHGILIHGGGWKKLQSEAVSREIFNECMKEVCGIREVRNYYGMAEQTGSISVECPCGNLHVSSYSDILIRNMEDFSCCRAGEEGVIQVMTPMAGSYPGHSILTEDKGMILGEDDCPCGRMGKYFRVTGRIEKAEIRGCSDTYEG